MARRAGRVVPRDALLEEAGRYDEALAEFTTPKIITNAGNGCGL